MPKWLLIAGTRCADPARETEFNDWYHGTHIPDILNVPGFMKGSRYEGATMSATQYCPEEDEARYLAFYEIESEDIGQTIKDMRDFAGKLRERGRMNPLIEMVTGAAYRQIAPTYVKSKPDGEIVGRNNVKPVWVFMVHGICADPAREQEFNEWYDIVHIPDITQTPGFARVTRYELSVVTRHNKPEGGPTKFLAIYEIEAEDIDQTMASMRVIGKGLREQGRMSPLYQSGGSRIYRQILPPIFKQ